MKVNIEPKRYDFENDSFHNKSTCGYVDAIATLWGELCESSDMTMQDIIQHILWNYDCDPNQMFDEVKDEVKDEVSDYVPDKELKVSESINVDFITYVPLADVNKQYKKLNKYCDYLNKECNSNADIIVKLLADKEQLEKSLDKACESIQFNVKCNKSLKGDKCDITDCCDCWKNYLLKEVQDYE